MLEIIRKEQVDTLYTIEDLKIGDLFSYESDVYMKIKEHDDCEGNYLNAVALEIPCLGECCYICEDEAVIPLDGSLQLWRREF